MKTLLSAITKLLFILFLPVSAFGQDAYITGGFYFNTEQQEVLPNPGIWIKSGKLFQIGGEVPEEAEVLTLEANDYVLPGLIDLHAHYRVAYNGVAHDDTLAMPKIFLANGVTATFPAGEIEPEKMEELRRRIYQKEMPGPRILNSGPYFGAAAPDWNPNFTTEDIYNRVDTWAARGVKGFKAKNITPEHLQALIGRAHQHGLTVTGHLNSGYRNSVNPENAVFMGIDRVEHFLGGSLLPDTTAAYYSLRALDTNDPALDSIIQTYIRHGVHFSPTLGTYGAIALEKGAAFEFWTDEKRFLTPFSRSLVKDLPRSNFSVLCEDIFRVKKETLRKYYQAGGKIVLGTDRPLLLDNFLGPQLGGFFAHREMQLMVDIGIPAEEAITIATLESARAIGMGSKLGSIAPGKWADLFIIKGNPLKDITRTRTVHTVIRAGNIYNSDTLLKQCEGKLGPVDEETW